MLEWHLLLYCDPPDWKPQLQPCEWCHTYTSNYDGVNSWILLDFGVHLLLHFSAATCLRSEHCTTVSSFCFHILFATAAQHLHTHTHSRFLCWTWYSVVTGIYDIKVDKPGPSAHSVLIYESVLSASCQLLLLGIFKRKKWAPAKHGGFYLSTDSEKLWSMSLINSVLSLKVFFSAASKMLINPACV